MKEKSKYNVLEMKDYILSRAKINANTAIILGSGMGAFADRLNSPTYISYNDIPNYHSPKKGGYKPPLVFPFSLY